MFAKKSRKGSIDEIPTIEAVRRLRNEILLLEGDVKERIYRSASLESAEGY